MNMSLILCEQELDLSGMGEQELDLSGLTLVGTLVTRTSLGPT